MLATKQCSVCEAVLPIDAFWCASKGRLGRQSRCKSCQKKALDEIEARNPGARNRATRASSAKHRDRVIWRQLRRRAGAENVCEYTEFAKWWNEAPLVCEYCGMSDAEAKDRFRHHLHIDRKDASQGYSLANITRACQRCNLTKNGYLSHAQMKEVAAKYFNGTAAPCCNSHYELLEALKAMVTTWEAHDAMENGVFSSADDILAINHRELARSEARAAIAKAEGK